MTVHYANEPLFDMFVFETIQLIEQLEESILIGEKSGCYSNSAINEIFRIMHTIKGSSAMMMFDNISLLAHSVEDLFFYIREGKPNDLDCSALSDLMLESIDFIKVEIEKVKNEGNSNGDASDLISKIKAFLSALQNNNSFLSSEKVNYNPDIEKQQYYISPGKINNSIHKQLYKATVYFEEGCEMENIRAFSIVHKMKDISDEYYYIPEDIIDSDESTDFIKSEGFKILLKSYNSYEQIKDFFMQTLFLKDLELLQLNNDDELEQLNFAKIKNPLHSSKKDSINSNIGKEGNVEGNDSQSASIQQSMISVGVLKLDKLMDLVGEMVIAEAMVIQNPDLKGFELGNFQKAARQLHKITGEMQDMVMSIRMVPVATTFHKMHRIVRDMCKKLGKEIQLKLKGEETEVDKNIIEHVSDPLMHLIRNAIDHGIETPEVRLASGKSHIGTITLEAKNSGSDVLIVISDDGKGLNKERILQRAEESGLLKKPAGEISDNEIYNLIFLPGFSTNENVTEFSGRGVGMDVVARNIETVGGTVSVDSTESYGTTVTLKIPLTLAIIDGMNIKVGDSSFTIPIISIKESFRPKESDIITDPDCNEMILVRGQCYPILRLHEHFKVKTDVDKISRGILIMVESGTKILCLFADELLGQQQVVVKALPDYIKNNWRINGLTGCTLLGDGSISLILDIGGLI